MKRLLRDLDGRTLWRLVLVSWVLLAGAAGLARAAALPAAAAAAAVLLVLSWTAALRFLLADSWGRWFWLWWFAAAGLMAGTAGTAGVAGAVAISGFGLTVRRYRAWRHVGARRRALGFGLGLLAAVLLVLAGPAWTAEPTGWALVLRNLGGWALGSLAFYWFWSLFHLAVRMQLHFLRLRAKLAVSAFLIGVVPLLLLGLLAAMMLYTGLGGARASGAAAILESWRTVAAEGSDLAPALFDTVFVWPDREGAAVPAGAVRLPAPPWTADLARQLSRAAPHDTTAWVAAAGDLWLMRWQGLGGPEPRARAWLLGQRPLTALSQQLRAGLVLTALGADNDGANVNIGTRDPVRDPVFGGRRVMHRDVTDDPSFWSDWRYFGGSLLEVLRHREGRVDDTSIFLTLRVGWTDLRSEFLEGEDNLNVAVVIALGLVAALFLVIEIFALFFGVRITEGIIAAVRSLGRGTRAVAAGDLEATISLPNEDEFGDLAADFNAMTRAVKKGRDDALARERLTRELQTAREIQERLLPHDEPRLAGFEITGASIPSREIGGDYFDFILQPHDRMGIAIGDVSGKGMPAALLMSNLQASLHGQVIHPSSVSQVVGRVNDLLVASTDPHMFATFFYGVLDTGTAVLTSTNAGHNPPLVLRADGQLAELGEGGLLLGMLTGQDYRQQETVIGPGDVVVLFTDGITEAVGPSSEPDDPDAMFGDAALVEVVRRHAHLPAVGIKEAILAAVANHTAGVEQSDDITLVVIRRQD